MKTLLTFMFCALLTACTTTQTGDSFQPLDASKAILTLRGMSCPLCANNVDGRLKKVDGVETVNIDLETGNVTVDFGSVAPTRAQLETAVKEAGFTLSVMELIP